MIFWLALAVAAYLFYKWGMSNYDYFEKRGVKFLKPVFLLGSNTNMFHNKKSLTEMIQNWYTNADTRNEK